MHSTNTKNTKAFKNLLNSIFLFLFVIPFYGQVQSYYNGLDLTKTENELFVELSNRISSTHTAIPYTSGSTDTWDVLKTVDEDPTNANNVLLIYGFDDNDGISDTDRTRDKNLQDTGGGDPGKWNREHVFAKSLAKPNLGTDEPGPGTDVNNLKPADADRNSLRSNRKFTTGNGDSKIISTNGGWYPGDEWKGDVARVIMYMYLRYHGDGSQISQTQCLPIDVGFGTPLTIDSNMIDLFLNWNIEDPVSDFENQRNDYIETVQGNRNPFIDNPYLATLIWGGVNAEDTWNLNNITDSEAPLAPTNLTSSNITDDTVEINWIASTDNIGVVDYLIYLDGIYFKTAYTTTLIISGLSENTNYTISVKARDAASNLSLESNLINIKTLEGPLVLFSEDFNNCSTINFFTYSEESNKDWACETQFGENNSGSMGINGYQQDVFSRDWLITNTSINFDENTGEKISFYTDAAYGTTPLELVYSTDYDGLSSPESFTWVSVPNITIPVHSDGGGTEEIYSFSDIDISSITGTVYFAFKYYSNNDPTRWTVDNFEIIADNNDDVDDDGVLNEDDLCSGTPAGESVDANGCSMGQLDDDNDGVQNSDDLCPSSPIGATVNTSGCAESQLDDDEDGVMNNLDLCENTPNGEIVNAAGCSNGQLDDDNDGVINYDDLCPNSTVGSNVDTNGCFKLTSNNFKIESISETCPNKNNGQILITVIETFDYVATINGTNYNFTKSGLTVDNLPPASYDICITISGENYEQCFNVEIDEGITISGKSTSVSGKVSFDIEQGTAPFIVLVNDQKTLETYSPTFVINAKHGDIIQVKSSVSCEGVFSKTVDSFSEILAYPNPSKGNFEIALPISQKEVTIEIYNIQSQLISIKEYPIIYGKVQLNIETKPTGLYMVKVNLEEPVLLKIIKE
ncbi:endonuclease [Lutibacter flavus]|uniref:Por secretion system C-terminal sorting domain-containing protein n=1 Tax=Lutibacter flavus TaxID=691689 RepID=A0A238X779_9FLAO|nr:endonuclease [Lutibacter flavus]SNR54184.1 Por secretion system C-terminal sorting domain-containing protein [Lutibacter flavus]